MTPDACTLRQKISAYPPRLTTPSCMRAPPESLMPIIGQPILTARSMTLQIFSANTSPSEPPSTLKSCEKMHTRRPSIVPWPVMTPSPTYLRASRPNASVRCTANASSSTKLPESSSRVTRSRALSLPRSCWRAIASSPAGANDCARFCASSSSSDSCGMAAEFRAIAAPASSRPPRLLALVERERIAFAILAEHHEAHRCFLRLAFVVEFHAACFRCGDFGVEVLHREHHARTAAPVPAVRFLQPVWELHDAEGFAARQRPFGAEVCESDRWFHAEEIGVELHRAVEVLDAVVDRVDALYSSL